ncbi:MAG: tetratricopeptide repeat protein [candidate division WOR-3 bacterium]|nr:MAG: tetratricopeptide repeat protein [candidate division WOR-3 bacterium]
MVRMIKILLIGSLFVQIGYSQTVTTDSLETMLNRAKEFYYTGEYESAIKELENALLYLKQLTQPDQVEAYKYLAFSYVAFGDRVRAKEQFKKALALDPTLELDPTTVSPKIIKVFEEAKAETTAPPAAQPGAPEVAAPEEKITRFDATIRSCCVAGWGQSYRGEKSKGKKLMIAWGVTLGTTLGSLIVTSTKKEAYEDLAFTQPSTAFDDAYNQYKLWYNITAVSTLAFLGVYLYNLYDIVFHTPPVRTSQSEPDRGLIFRTNGDLLQVGYNFKF